MNIGMPAGAFQMRRGYEGIAAVVAFAGEDEAVPGARKQLLHCLCDGRPRLIHESFSRDAASKRGIFCLTHLRRSNDRRVHCSSELTFFFSVLEDFFLVEVLWRRCFVPDSRTKR